EGAFMAFFSAKAVGSGLAAMLYGALVLGATPAAAELTADQVAALKEARQGDMKKLVIHDEPWAKIERRFQTESGASKSLADFEGKVMIVNFWATWCPPCRKEMPYLDALKGEIGGDEVDVMAIAMDRASPEKIKEFFLSIEAENLKIYREPTLRIGTEAGILGLPVTIILAPDGREVARLQGEAVWNGPDAKDMIARIVAALNDAEG
ncbi:MAG: TlpA disulfide reductase family protein, partial [Pseudomonadota bacterium]